MRFPEGRALPFHVKWGESPAGWSPETGIWGSGCLGGG